MIRFGFPDIFDDEVEQLLVELGDSDIEIRSDSVDIQLTPTEDIWE